jgi:hypothetical protein
MKLSNDYSGYWETDEFEDLVARGLIGLYETKIKRQKKVPRCIRFDDESLARFRKMGCYFSPHDREFSVKFSDKDEEIVSSVQEIDMLNDGVPDRAVITFRPDIKEGSYLWGFYIEKLPGKPKAFNSDIHGDYFRITQLDFTKDSVWGGGTILVINKKGVIQSCYTSGLFLDPNTNRPRHIQKHRPVMDDGPGSCEDYYSVWGSITIQTYQDRRYLWNVRASDGEAKAVFGVYPEQIKSLFYARDLPQTGSGRKRPILHWVQAHQRRMQSGIEVDVEQYLRGTHEFVMNGTKFKIVNPLKEVK